MKKVFFLVNTLSEFVFGSLIEKYLLDVHVSVGESLPQHSEEYDLIVLWNYRKIIKGVQDKKNIIIFHSADLPEGRGWAPIYYSISNNKEFYVVSGILAGEGVDTGDIIVKARFRIRDNYTAEMIRQWDNEISISLIKDILKRFDGKELKGIKQEGKASTYSRRTPKDNEVRVDLPLSDIINHLRACEKQHPAFFYFNKIKYFIKIEPEYKAEFPDDLEIIFPDFRETEE